MFTLKRASLSIMVLVSLFTAAIAQEEKGKNSSVVTASVSGERVRFTAPSSVVQMHLEVYTETAVKLFDFELKGGNVFDWHLQNGQAERIGAGSYLCVVTVKELSGKLTQKIGRINVSEQLVTLETAQASKLNAQQAQAVGPMEEDSSITVLKADEPKTTTVIAHNGEEGQVIRSDGALSFKLGDFYSGKDTEQMRLSEEGNLGIGVKDPQAKLDVDGFIRATQGIVFPDGSIQFSASKKTYGQQSAGPGQFAKHPQSGQEHFETQATGTGTQNFIAKWTETGGAGTLGNSIIFDNGTNVGIGTTTPAKKLDVRGGQIALDNGRFLYSRRTNEQFQEAFGIDSNDDIVFNRNSLVPGVDLDAPKASSALIFGTGAGKFMDIRNSANAPILRAVEATGNIGIGTFSPSAKLEVAGDVKVTGLRTEDNAISPNVVGGSSGNSVTAGIVGATIGGGGVAAKPNRITDYYGTVGGGVGNQAGNNNVDAGDKAHATVGGGRENTASGANSTVGGGVFNTASVNHSTVGGGLTNSASGESSTVGGGRENTASGSYSTVGGGVFNTASGPNSTVGGGLTNSASGESSTVGGGFTNTASGPNSTVGGGNDNTASGNVSTVGGGNDNTASGFASTVPGGSNNIAAGDYSFAAGRRAKANHTGAFVWADSASADFASTANDQFLIRASGGVGIGTPSPAVALHVQTGVETSLRLETTNSALYANTRYTTPSREYHVGMGGSTAVPELANKFYIRDQTAPANRMVIDTSGFVGIGTTSPADRLHVAGELRVNSCVKNSGGTQIAGTCSSDLRFKKQITPFASVIDRISRLQPVHFYWKVDEYPEKHFGSAQSYGLIAQEVEKVLPELVGEDESGYKLVNYSKLPLLMLQAVKDLKAENDSLQMQNAALEKRNAEQDARLKALEQKIRQIAEESGKRRSAKASIPQSSK